MGILGKKGMPGLMKCVSFQDALQGGIFYIYNSLLDYLARTCGNGKKCVQLKTFAFQCWLAEAVTILCSRGENWEVSGQVKGI